MLETEIKKLTAEIIALREAFEKMGHPAQVCVNASGALEPMPERSEPKAEKAESQETEKVSPQADDVSVEDLQRYCLQVIRNDRSLKDPIKKLVQDMTGAKFMEDVPADKAGELKAAIEALVGA